MGVKQWAAVACSIVGNLHIKKNLPNQDAISFYNLPGSSPAFVMAVSDGHGSENCPRSDVGSALAVNTAVKVFIDFWCVMKSRLDHSETSERPSVLANIERHVRKDLTKQLVENWVVAVETHLASVPFQADQDKFKRLLAYGATLTIVFLCEHFTVCMRLGDCEVLTVERDSRVSRITPRDREQIGEETDSLCMPNADKRFSVSFHCAEDVALRGSKLYMICSDGYEKAFASNAGFEQSAIDFAKLVSSGKGRETVEQELESWLREYSNYSGDDVSVGLLFDKPQPAESIAFDKSVDNAETVDRSAAIDAVLIDDYASNRNEEAKFKKDYPPETNDKI
jgi:serine/threonine protein phosphatase PrpC